MNKEKFNIFIVIYKFCILNHPISYSPWMYTIIETFSLKLFSFCALLLRYQTKVKAKHYQKNVFSQCIDFVFFSKSGLSKSVCRSNAVKAGSKLYIPDKALIKFFFLHKSKARNIKTTLSKIHCSIIVSNQVYTPAILPFSFFDLNWMNWKLLDNK